MALWTALLWMAGGLAFVGLVVAAYRGVSGWPRVLLALTASAALATGMTGTPLALAFLGLNVALVLATWRLAGGRGWWVWVATLIALLALAKLPVLQPLAGGREAARGSLPGLGPGVWLGVSYFVFRLIHVTVDVHMGRAKDFTLPELLVYALHPASLVAGPIDRLENSVQAQRSPGAFAENAHQGLWRILRGAFGKFVIANGLFAFIARHDMTRNPDQPTGVAWLWLAAYSFYILADFAAYSDVAIGFGRLAGLNLPENFSRPYFSPSMTVFWQRWHISLSSWLRDYLFFPLARRLRLAVDPRLRSAAQAASQITTMVATGLWHGLTPGFAVWGVWHGLGVFAAARLGLSQPERGLEGWSRCLAHGAGVAGTYLFVTLGWVFFAADLPTAIRILARLFGIA